MNQREIQIDVLLTASDYVRANYWFLFKKLKMLIGLLLFAGVGYPLLVVAGVIEKGPTDNFWGLLIPLGLLALILGGTYIGAKRQMVSNKALSENQRYIFSDDGVKTQGVSSFGFQQWENIREAYETQGNFLLFLSLNQLYVIPKRCFLDADQIAQFKKLLKEHLGIKLKSK